MIYRIQFALCIPAVQSHFQQSAFPAGVFYQHGVVLADTQFTKHIFGNVRTSGLYEIVELQVFGVFDSLTVNHHLSVDNLERITGKTNTTFNVILSAVYGTPEDFSVSTWII